jgi:Glycosyl hydrolase family 26
VPLGGAFIGLWRSGNGSLTETQARNDLLSREAYFGRKVDIWASHYGTPKGSCYGTAPFATGSEAWNWGRGVYSFLSWSPGYTISAVNSGVADACFHDAAKRFKAFGHPVWFRLWHEFNGSWYLWSYDPSNAQAFINAWQRVVGIFKSEGATNAMFTWCPDEGYYNPNKRPSGYPGDAYVDWVCSDGYNWNRSNAWCTTHPGWCEFWEIFHHGGAAVPSVEQDFRGRKPYLVGETGSIEDTTTAGRKGQWMLNMRNRIKSDFSNLRALLYYDNDMTATQNVNWRLDTSQSSLEGFRALAQDAYFRTRP